MADGQGGGGFSAYGWGQSLSDMLGGYLGETDKIRQENEKEQAQQLDVEKTMLQHLMSADDPNVKAAAMNAFLTPKKAGPGPLAKWYNQQSTSPAFAQLQTILGQAKGSPWLSIQEKEAQQTSGAIQGKGEGWAQTFSNITGRWPTEEETTHALQGFTGSPPRTLGQQHGTFFFSDDQKPTEDYGSYDPTTGEYTIRGQPVTRPGQFVPGGQLRSEIAGGGWQTLPGGKQRQWFDPYGNPLKGSKPVDIEPPPPMIFMGPGGAIPVNPRAGTAGAPIPGTQDTLAVKSAARTEAEAHQKALEDLEATVRNQANRAAQGITGFQQYKFDESVDQIARELSGGMYQTYRELTAALRQAREALLALTQQEQQKSTPQSPQSPQPQQGTPPPGGVTPQAAPGGRGAPPQGATPQPQQAQPLGAPGPIDEEKVKAMVRELQLRGASPGGGRGRAGMVPQG